MYPLQNDLETLRAWLPGHRGRPPAESCTHIGLTGKRAIGMGVNALIAHSPASPAPLRQLCRRLLGVLAVSISTLAVGHFVHPSMTFPSLTAERPFDYERHPSNSRDCSSINHQTQLPILLRWSRTAPTGPVWQQGLDTPAAPAPAPAS